MATKPVYTEGEALTLEKCRSLLAQVLGLDEAVADEELLAAAESNIADQAEQEPETPEEDAAAAEEPEPAMPMKGKPKYRGSAMSIMTKPMR